MQPIQKIAKLLRTPEYVLVDLFEKMEKLTGKKGVAEKIYSENQQMVKQKLEDLGIPEEKADAQYLETEILKKTREADQSFYQFLGQPDYSSQSGCQQMIKIIKDISGVKSGFFLREEKLQDFLFLNPPKNVLSSLGYKDIKEALVKEDIYHILSALRFVENERWLNEVFFRPYHDLIADNFEEKEIKIEVLPEKWAAIGQKFAGQKLHHISHLKEVGLVFVIPAEKENFIGQTLETFSLILHYLYEIDFYSCLFKKYSTLPNFGSNSVKLLSAEVSAFPLPKEGISWRIIQRYLAKINDSDPRLFEPHINPEPLHWSKAENEMDKLAKRNPQIKLSFWQGMDDFVGEIFPAGKRGEEIVSFDLIDNVISLTKSGLTKYLYHQQEALWNKIFIEFMGMEKLEQILMENLDKGYISLSAKIKN